jgi:hypothetical protein
MPKSAGTKLPSIALAAGRPLANRGQPQSKLTKLEQQLSSLVEQVAELRKELKSSLASREGELGVLRSDLRIIDAHLAFLRQPDDLRVARRLLARLNESERELPDDIQETTLRFELRNDPYNLSLTLPLVAVDRCLGVTDCSRWINLRASRQLGSSRQHCRYQTELPGRTNMTLRMVWHGA